MRTKDITDIAKEITTTIASKFSFTEKPSKGAKQDPKVPEKRRKPSYVASAYVLVIDRVCHEKGLDEVQKRRVVELVLKDKVLLEWPEAHQTLIRNYLANSLNLRPNLARHQIPEKSSSSSSSSSAMNFTFAGLQTGIDSVLAEQKQGSEQKQEAKRADPHQGKFKKFFDKITSGTFIPSQHLGAKEQYEPSILEKLLEDKKYTAREAARDIHLLKHQYFSKVQLDPRFERIMALELISYILKINYFGLKEDNSEYTSLANDLLITYQLPIQALVAYLEENHQFLLANKIVQRYKRQYHHDPMSFYYDELEENRPGKYIELKLLHEKISDMPEVAFVGIIAKLENEDRSELANELLEKLALEHEQSEQKPAPLLVTKEVVIASALVNNEKKIADKMMQRYHLTPAMLIAKLEKSKRPDLAHRVLQYYGPIQVDVIAASEAENDFRTAAALLTKYQIPSQQMADYYEKKMQENLAQLGSLGLFLLHVDKNNLPKILAIKQKYLGASSQDQHWLSAPEDKQVLKQLLSSILKTHNFELLHKLLKKFELSQDALLEFSLNKLKKSQALPSADPNATLKIQQEDIKALLIEEISFTNISKKWQAIAPHEWSEHALAAAERPSKERLENILEGIIYYEHTAQYEAADKRQTMYRIRPQEIVNFCMERYALLEQSLPNDAQIYYAIAEAYNSQHPKKFYKNRLKLGLLQIKKTTEINHRDLLTQKDKKYHAFLKAFGNAISQSEYMTSEQSAIASSIVSCVLHYGKARFDEKNALKRKLYHLSLEFRKTIHYGQNFSSFLVDPANLLPINIPPDHGLRRRKAFSAHNTPRGTTPEAKAITSTQSAPETKQPPQQQALQPQAISEQEAYLKPHLVQMNRLNEALSELSQHSSSENDINKQFLEDLKHQVALLYQNEASHGLSQAQKRLIQRVVNESICFCECRNKVDKQRPIVLKNLGNLGLKLYYEGSVQQKLCLGIIGVVLGFVGLAFITAALGASLAGAGVPNPIAYALALCGIKMMAFAVSSTLTIVASSASILAAAVVGTLALGEGASALPCQYDPNKDKKRAAAKVSSPAHGHLKNAYYTMYPTNTQKLGKMLMVKAQEEGLAPKPSLFPEL